MEEIIRRGDVRKELTVLIRLIAFFCNTWLERTDELLVLADALEVRC